MNNEPVAWMLVDEINGDYMLEKHPSGDYDWIPLYTHPAPTKVKFASDSCESGWIYLENTHPVKEQLTDEEIYKIFKKFYVNMNSDKNEEPEYGIDERDFNDCAREILRQAQEK